MGISFNPSCISYTEEIMMINKILKVYIYILFYAGKSI